jgi:zinc transport system permease protein
MFELIFPAWLSGIILSLITGPLGSFIVWRKMSSFGDTLSHSALLGLSLSIMFNSSAFFVVFFTITVLAIILAWLEERLPFALDTIINIISHTSLALGIVCMSLMSNNYPQQIDITNYLFGDLLAVTESDLMIMGIGAIIVLSVLIFFWNSILLSTINEELSKIDGVNPFFCRLVVMLMTALTISMSIKFVGALLITSLLIIPPATAQNVSGSPEKMVMIAIIVSMMSVTGGILCSIYYNTPPSPSIVLCASFFCLLSNIKKIF